jgi:hypothetical protein
MPCNEDHDSHKPKPGDELLCSLSLLLHADPSLPVIDPALGFEYACLDGCVPGIGDTPREGKGD